MVNRRLTQPLSALVLSAALLSFGCGGGSNGTAPLSITTTSLPDGQVGSAYSATMSARGGRSPLSWSVNGGVLPHGLSLNGSTGVLSGTPAEVTSKRALTFKVTDSGSPPHANTASLTLSVAPAPLVISSSSLPSGTVGAAYSATLDASGGTAPYTWSASTGSLPPGLSLAAATGVISGTPAAPVTNLSVTITVSDSGSPALTHSAALTISIAPLPLTIPATSLPTGQLGSGYSANLPANGGTQPFSWTVTSGTLPRGLSLNAQTGAITGVPGAVVSNTPLTFQVQDSGNPVQNASVNLTLTVNSAALSVSLSLKRAGLTVTQSLSLSATTNDAAGVTWNISPAGGSFSPAASVSGANVTLTAPAAPGSYTVTATSVSDTTQTASALIGVTDLAGTYTYHNDLSRDGANSREYALSPANVASASFGKLFSCTVDGAISAQPLWVANLHVGGETRNVVFVATQHDGLFAFDADTSPCLRLWFVNLLDGSHGGTSGERTVPSGPSGNLVGGGVGDITPEVGVTGTPVIDPASRTLYVVSKSVNAAGTTFYQRLHAIDLSNGSEKPGSPTPIAATFPGSGDGGSTVTFNPRTENQRAGLALVNGTVYLAWGSHEDNGPYYGWLIGYSYDGTKFTQSSVLNVTPNAIGGGIWMSGGAPAADAAGNVYVITGNGRFDATSTTPPHDDYGDSFLQLSASTAQLQGSSGTGSLSVSGYFTPSDYNTDDLYDLDFGAGGAALLAELPVGSPVTHLVIGGGKDSTLYVLNRDALGGLGDVNAWQQISLGPLNSSTGAIFSTPALWNNYLYVAGVGTPLSAYQLDASTAKFSLLTSTTAGSGFARATPAVSAAGNSNGIVWVLDTTKFCTPESSGCGPAVLHAYDATNLANQLWSSAAAANGADAAGYAVKFTVPTIANGKVYVGTRGNDTGSTPNPTVPGELDVYGLKPN